MAKDNRRVSFNSRVQVKTFNDSTSEASTSTNNNTGNDSNDFTTDLTQKIKQALLEEKNKENISNIQYKASENDKDSLDDLQMTDSMQEKNTSTFSSNDEYSNIAIISNQLKDFHLQNKNTEKGHSQNTNGLKIASYTLKFSDNQNEQSKDRENENIRPKSENSLNHATNKYSNNFISNEDKDQADKIVDQTKVSEKPLKTESKHEVILNFATQSEHGDYDTSYSYLTFREDQIFNSNDLKLENSEQKYISTPSESQKGFLYQQNKPSAMCVQDKSLSLDYDDLNVSSLAQNKDNSHFAMNQRQNPTPITSDKNPATIVINNKTHENARNDANFEIKSHLQPFESKFSQSMIVNHDTTPDHILQSNSKASKRATMPYAFDINSTDDLKDFYNINDRFLGDTIASRKKVQNQSLKNEEENYVGIKAADKTLVFSLDDESPYAYNTSGHSSILSDADLHNILNKINASKTNVNHTDCADQSKKKVQSSTKQQVGFELSSTNVVPEDTGILFSDSKHTLVSQPTKDSCVQNFSNNEVNERSMKHNQTMVFFDIQSETAPLDLELNLNSNDNASKFSKTTTIRSSMLDKYNNSSIPTQKTPNNMNSYNNVSLEDENDEGIHFNPIESSDCGKRSLGVDHTSSLIEPYDKHRLTPDEYKSIEDQNNEHVLEFKSKDVNTSYSSKLSGQANSALKSERILYEQADLFDVSTGYYRNEVSNVESLLESSFSRINNREKTNEVQDTVETAQNYTYHEKNHAKVEKNETSLKTKNNSSQNDEHTFQGKESSMVRSQTLSTEFENQSDANKMTTLRKSLLLHQPRHFEAGVFNKNNFSDQSGTITHTKANNSFYNSTIGNESSLTSKIIAPVSLKSIEQILSQYKITFWDSFSKFKYRNTEQNTISDENLPNIGKYWYIHSIRRLDALIKETLELIEEKQLQIEKLKHCKVLANFSSSDEMPQQIASLKISARLKSKCDLQNSKIRQRQEFIKLIASQDAILQNRLDSPIDHCENVFEENVKLKKELEKLREESRTLKSKNKEIFNDDFKNAFLLKLKQCKNYCKFIKQIESSKTQTSEIMFVIMQNEMIQNNNLISILVDANILDHKNTVNLSAKNPNIAKACAPLASLNNTYKRALELKSQFYNDHIMQKEKLMLELEDLVNKKSILKYKHRKITEADIKNEKLNLSILAKVFDADIILNNNILILNIGDVRIEAVNDDLNLTVPMNVHKYAKFTAFLEKIAKQIHLSDLSDDDARAPSDKTTFYNVYVAPYGKCGIRSLVNRLFESTVYCYNKK